MHSKVQIFWEGLDLSYVVTVKSTVEILQNFLAFSEYMNFNWEDKSLIGPTKKCWPIQLCFSQF